MRNTILGCIVAVQTMLFAGLATAETCGGTYEVRPGDSLSGIADRFYRDSGKWTAIQSANADLIGQDLNNIKVGMRLRLRCIDGLPRGLPEGQPMAAAQPSARAAAPAHVAPVNAATRRKINVLTGSDFAPFTDKSLPEGGMLAAVVQAAMEAAAPEQGFAIHWVDDWAAHQDPLLSNGLLDIGFPWSMPACDAEPETYRCANLDFSDSMFEVLLLLFVDADRPLSFHKDADLAGARLCRPSGYSVYIFDQNGRNWLKNGMITLQRAGSPSECFRLLMEGEVDGVVLNEFLGRRKIKELDLGGRVRVADGQPISVDGNHMVAHKSHPQGRAFLKVFEDGLAKIKANGTYQRIVDAHMTRVWAEF